MPTTGPTSEKIRRGVGPGEQCCGTVPNGGATRVGEGVGDGIQVGVEIADTVGDCLTACGGDVEAQAVRSKRLMSKMLDRVKVCMILASEYPFPALVFKRCTLFFSLFTV